MMVIDSHWQKRQSRTEDGIYFGTDEFIVLRGTPGEGYRVDVRRPVAALLETAPDGWTDLDEICSAQAGDFQLFAGSTPWEGSGFVAAEQRSTGRLHWLLQLEGSEAFTKISSDGETIHAVSAEYPFRSEWRIPIHAPEKLSVTQFYET